MNGIVHPFTGALHEQDGRGNIRVTLDGVAAMLEVFVSPIYFDPSDAAVGTEEFWVRVTPVCSGSCATTAWPGDSRHPYSSDRTSSTDFLAITRR